MVRLVLIAYDIADPRRLRHVAKVLEKSGERIQKSVFECGLSFDAQQSLKMRLERIIDPMEDSVMFVPLGQGSRANIRWQGKPPNIASEPFWIV